jgi:S1-C subfamily serine protease
MSRRFTILWLAALAFSGCRWAGEEGPGEDFVWEKNQQSSVRIQVLLENIQTYERGASPQGSGTGFIIDPAGLVLTNYHIVAYAQEAFVQMQEDESLPARVVAIDPILDLALLELTAPHPAVVCQDLSDWRAARLGEHVTFCASPLGLFKSTLYGRVSAVERLLSNTLVRYIQLDGVASQGASGAAVTDGNGAFLGILARHAAQNANVGFVIPASYCIDFVRQFQESGEIRATWFGLEFLATGNGPGRARALLVNGIQNNSPAARTSLQVGDQVLRIDGRDVTGQADAMTWRYYLYAHGAEQPLELTVADPEGHTRTVQVMPLVFRYRYPHEFWRRDLGIMVQHRTPFDRIGADSTYRPGLTVTRLVNPSLAGHFSVGDYLSEDTLP